MSASPQPVTPQEIAAMQGDGKSADNWAGLTDPAERRRRQNRINQRAHRRRLRMKANQDVHPKSVVASASPTALVPQDESRAGPMQSESLCVSPSFAQLLLSRYAASAYHSYMLGSPTSDHLLVLTKVNVFRAFGHNLKLIGWPLDNMDDDAISPFSLPSTPEVPGPEEYSYLPPSLRPTRLQRTIPHHPWLDFFPLPKMRDNLIQAGDQWDDDALCHDIMGFWGETTSSGQAGLLVWGDPWDIRNWELTEPFLKKWQWIVRGCPEIMNSTNAWRARRGEKLIFRYI
ncbi:uncharacterized protein N7482_004841 [Penicillium canariense]|uniref:BZIP domain-containing protein n=1 Tax=Penicillium canariense TaxID=189055 RepID=A0A9W9ID69_9EURO|nr:uncharacterized protein N7482_004841 [Penicillium canariense]KAJ5169247.1 hypothetical protein N7482_004841 [Penicillium canariense]